jgi:hypothetical protein
VQVGVAGAGAADAEQHLARPGLGDRDVPELGRLLPVDELVGVHDRLLSIG